MSIFDNISDKQWTNNCEAARNYLKFLEDELVNENDTEIVTYLRINPLLPCKKNCQFDRILSVPSNFSEDKVNFAKNVLKRLNPEISCRTSIIGQLIPPPESASDLIANIGNLIFHIIYKLIIITFYKMKFFFKKIKSV